jgi:hypothetical protein
MLQNATPLRKSAPWLLNISAGYVSCNCACHTTCILTHPDASSSNVPRLPSFLKLLQSQHAWLTFDKAQNPWRLPRKIASGPQKAAFRDHQRLTLLTSKCASRPSGVHIFQLSTTKSAPGWGAFTLLASTCASRRNCGHFFNFSTTKSAPELGCFYPFHFEMCFVPQRRALFNVSTSKSNQVFFNILAWECASRYNGEHFFNISTCKRGSELKCF